MTYMLVSIVFGLLFVMPWVLKHVWPAFDSFFNVIWEDPTDRAARRMLKEMKDNHVLEEMSGTEGEIEILAAQTGIQRDEILKSINALTPSEAAAIFQAVRTGKPLALVKILKILTPKEKASRMPRGDGY